MKFLKENLRLVLIVVLILLIIISSIFSKHKKSKYVDSDDISIVMDSDSDSSDTENSTSSESEVVNYAEEDIYIGVDENLANTGYDSDAGLPTRDDKPVIEGADTYPDKNLPNYSKDGGNYAFILGDLNQNNMADVFFNLLDNYIRGCPFVTHDFKVKYRNGLIQGKVGGIIIKEVDFESKYVCAELYVDDIYHKYDITFTMRDNLIDDITFKEV